MGLDTLLLLAGLGLSIFLVGFGLGMLYAQRRASSPENPAGGSPAAAEAFPIPEGLAPELGALAEDLARAATERWEAARAAAGSPAGKDAAPTDEEVMLFDRVSLGISKLPLFASHREYEVAERGVMASVAERYGLTAEQVADTYRKVHAWKWRQGGEGTPGPA
ncbi:MAG: hypothetical protein HY575_03230 [candidate division NC10 bacterium]|nr:hypothetical protein [candidate division NC10 bacterium]MBI4390872.1 hypothetical protein [candidate division NC10 bacterium]